MGSGTFDSDAYRSTQQDFSNKTRDQIFDTKQMKKEFNPYGVKMRESRDNEGKGNSNAIIVASDVTASMGIISEVIARHGVGDLFNNILTKRPVSDPHLMFMAIGDAFYDSAPLQVTQFEADNRIVEQLTGLWLEGGGGGNAGESYHLPWYFAARKTSIDCYEKRGKKGYLFTVGDEPAPPALTSDQVLRIFGDATEGDLSPRALLTAAQQKYNVYHIIIEEGDGPKRYDNVKSSWTELLGENALSLRDHTKLADGIYSIIERNEASLGNTKRISGSSEMPHYLALA